MSIEIDKNSLKCRGLRGLLCNNCNRGIGHLKDSPMIIEKALKYLTDNKLCQIA